jgi:hypothetical protein
MKLLISAPSGYNTRELLLPLHKLLEADHSITEVHVVSPAAPWRQELFPAFSDKFHFWANPGDQAQHTALLRRLNPAIVVTPTIGLDPLDVPIIRAAKACAVPTCTFVASWDNVYKMERVRQFHQDHEMPDYFAVWNQANYDQLLGSFSQVQSEHVAIVGAPRFDYFSHTNRIPTWSTLCAYLGISEEKSLIHGATTELYPFNYILRTLYKAQRSGNIKKPVSLYVSVHPGGDIRKHAPYAHKYQARVKYSFGRRTPALAENFAYLPTEAEMYLLVALFKYTSVLVNQSSTVTIESMLADVPVVNVKYGKRFDWLRWHRSMVYRDFQQHFRDIMSGGGTTIVSNRQQLITSVNEYLQEPALKRTERAATIQKIITFTDGSASARLLQYVKHHAA